MGDLQEKMRDVASEVVIAEGVGEVNMFVLDCFVVEGVDAFEIVEIVFVRVECV